MFKKFLTKFQVNASCSSADQRSPSSHVAPIILDLDARDRVDEDGFLLIGDTATERSVCGSVENSLDLPPSYDDSLSCPPVYADLYPASMGARNSKQELFEPTLHTASRQISQEAPSTTQNDILKPFFQALQNERNPTDPSAEQAVLCTTAPPCEESEVQNTGAAAAAGNALSSAHVAPTTPYEDIPFRLSPVLATGHAANSLGAASQQIASNERSLAVRYQYDFKLERGVLRDN